MKTPIITTHDTGNGNMIEIAMLITKGYSYPYQLVKKKLSVVDTHSRIISSQLSDV